MLYLFFIKNSNRNVIVGASTLTAGNIKKGVKIFNVTGTWVGWVDNTMNCTNLAHFSISYSGLNELIRIFPSNYFSFAKLHGFELHGVEHDNKTYLEENVLPYFSYIKVTATGKVDTDGGVASGHVDLFVLYSFHRTANLTDQGRAVMDTVYGPLTDGSPCNMSGSAYVKINQGIWSGYPYIYGAWACIGNDTDNRIYATITSVKFEFAKTNS